MSLLVPIFLASFVLFQVFDLEVGKPKNTNKAEVATSENESVDINNKIVLNEPEEEVKVEEPKEEVKVEEPKEEVKVEEPKEEVKVEEPKEEVKVEEPKEEVKVEENNNQNSSEQETETISQNDNGIEEQVSDSSTNWLMVALYIFLGIFLLATASYYFVNRNKNNQKSAINEEPVSSNEESSERNVNTPSEEIIPNPAEPTNNENNQSNNQEEDNQEEDNQDNKNN